MKFVFERKSSKSTISTVFVDESATSEEDVVRSGDNVPVNGGGVLVFCING